MTSRVDRWFAALGAEHNRIASELRALIHAEAPMLREELKWGRPCYYGRALVLYLQGASSHVALGFGQGVHLPDPVGILSGQGSQLRHVRMLLNARPDRDALAALIRAAIHLDQLG